VSGDTPDSYGSMLELCWNGTRPMTFPAGSIRQFLEDGDRVTMRAYGERAGVRVGFGALQTKILPPGNLL
jgi:fumarylacetoacetase